jgi:glycosyltransferase involved in cell wall biosynthesis
MSPRLPSPAIVMEWENALVYGANRAEQGLSELVCQLRQCANAMDEPTELVIAFDSTRVTQDAIFKSLSASLGPSDWPMHVTLHPVSPGAGYAAYHNEAFRRTSRDIVVFFDSDVIPEPGWLEQILLPFLNDGIGVVAGNTYIDPIGLYARACALFWFFPPRCRENGLRPTNYFFLNNVAFRRDIFARFPFPEAGYFRGKAYKHAREIWRAGIPVMQQMAARASHPPPIGVRYFVLYGLCRGDDHALWEREGFQPPLAAFTYNLRTAMMRITGRRRELNADWLSVAVSVALAVTYYGIVLIGHLIGRAHPKLVQRYFPL